MVLQERHELRLEVLPRKTPCLCDRELRMLARLKINSAKLTLFENPINISLIPRIALNQQPKKGIDPVNSYEFSSISFAKLANCQTLPRRLWGILTREVDFEDFKQ